MYVLFKTLHIIGVVVLLGNVTITAYWKVLADRTSFGRLGTTRPDEGPLELSVPGPRLRGDAGFLID